MKKLILLILLSTGLSAHAQENLFEVVRFCQAVNAYELTVSATEEVYSIRLNPSHSELIELETSGAGQYSFTIPSDNEWLEVRAITLQFQPIAMLYFADAPLCETQESFDIVAFMREMLPREIPLWTGE